MFFIDKSLIVVSHCAGMIFAKIRKLGATGPRAFTAGLVGQDVDGGVDRQVNQRNKDGTVIWKDINNCLEGCR